MGVELATSRTQSEGCIDWANLTWYWSTPAILFLAIQLLLTMIEEWSFPVIFKLFSVFAPGKKWLSCLTAHKWQKWKRVFLTCPCHKIYRDEAVGLKVANILEKLWYLWKCEIWSNTVKIWYFVNNCLIEAQIRKFFCTCVTQIIVIICSTAHFLSTKSIFS